MCKISSIPAAEISWQFEGKVLRNNTRLEGGGLAVVREARLHQDRTLSTINILGSKGTSSDINKIMGNIRRNLDYKYDREQYFPD